jgi:hypothetical protein
MGAFAAPTKSAPVIGPRSVEATTSQALLLPGPSLVLSACAFRGIKPHHRQLPLSATALLGDILLAQMFLALAGNNQDRNKGHVEQPRNRFFARLVDKGNSLKFATHENKRTIPQSNLAFELCPGLLPHPSG